MIRQRESFEVASSAGEYLCFRLPKSEEKDGRKFTRGGGSGVGRKEGGKSQGNQGGRQMYFRKGPQCL